MRQQHCGHKGFITLISVLLTSVVGLTIALSLLLLGLGSSKTSLALSQSNEAKSLANACAEEALQQIRTSTSYAGSGDLTLGQGICTYTVTGPSVPKTITASGTVGTIIRRVSISVNAVNPRIVISSWQEVAD